MESSKKPQVCTAINKQMGKKVKALPYSWNPTNKFRSDEITKAPLNSHYYIYFKVSFCKALFNYTKKQNKFFVPFLHYSCKSEIMSK